LLFESACDRIPQDLVCVTSILSFHISAEAGDLGSQFLEWVLHAGHFLKEIVHFYVSCRSAAMMALHRCTDIRNLVEIVPLNPL
jgi:hypothetical protein